MSCPNSSWISSTALIRTSNRSPIFIPRKQIWERVFHLMSWYANEVRMHDMKSMKWCVVHKRFDRSWFITKTCTNFEEERKRRKHLSNPNPFFTNFLVESHYLDYPLVNLFFSKFSPFVFKNFSTLCFSTPSFHSNKVIFLTFRNIYFLSKWIRHSFFDFSFYSK